MSSELHTKPNKERALAVTVPLLILHLALLSLQIEGPSGTLVFKSWSLAVQAPILSFCAGITGGIRNIWTGYVWLVGARQQNEDLKKAVHRLSQLNDSYAQIRRENDRLRRLLSLNEALGYKTIGARVVARTPGFLANVLYVDRGSADGIHVDAPVISSDGIIGRTVLVSSRQSQVQLITNPDASVGVMIERTRTPGVLRGTGELLLDLVYISNTEQVVQGDLIQTSGLDGVYPKGLTVGKVVESRKGNTVFRDIKVQPVMDFYRIEEVSVVLRVPEPPQVENETN